MNRNRSISFFSIFFIIAFIFFAVSACINKGIYPQHKNFKENVEQAQTENTFIESSEIKNGLAAETFLADIAQNITKKRMQVSSLMPVGIDPHEFEPIPADFIKISKNKILIINGSGFEGWLEQMIINAGSSNYIIEASKGLMGRTDFRSENSSGNKKTSENEKKAPVTDPHFWLDPIYVVEYVKNICSELIKIDPEGKDIYQANSQNYIKELKQLDAWIADRVKILPENKRLIVTNHESFGYFADRYGFQIIGTIIPGFSTDVSITAKEFAGLIDAVRSSDVKVIFLETGSNPNLAEQLASETGIKVVYKLYTHSLSGPDGDAETYIEMMKFNVDTIVKNLQ